MKAYKCDICGTFVEGLPLGVLYDNDVRKRIDMCPKCLAETNSTIDGMKGESRDIPNS